MDSFIVPVISKLKNIEQLGLKTGTTQQLRELLDNNSINISIYISSENRSKASSKLIHHGKFVVASMDGKEKDKIVATEDRPEVIALKKHLGKVGQSKLVKIESWTTGLKIAHAMNMACLIPDILLGKEFKKTPSNFKYDYKVILEHRPLEYLTDIEIDFMKHVLSSRR